jgi:uncharacterized protein YxjI
LRYFLNRCIIQVKNGYKKVILHIYSFNIIHNEHIVAAICKKINSQGDSYEIEIYGNEDIELHLFVIILLDQITHVKKKIFSQLEDANEK